MGARRGRLSRWNAGIPQQGDRDVLSSAADWIMARSRAADWPRAGRRVIEIGNSAVTVIWQPRQDGLQAILLAPRLLADWVGLAARRDARGVASISLLSDAGTLVVGPKLTPGLRTTVRSGTETGLPWALAVSGPAEDLTIELQSRRRLLGSGLAALSLLLAGGSYLLWRVVKRELAIARLHGDFVAAVSHEFRTPLTALRHITELLQESDHLPADRRRSFYAVLGHSTERLHRLVESLLDFARMEDGRRTWDLQTLNLADSVCRIVVDFRREHPGRLVSCTTDGSSTPVVRADAAALTQAVWNLLDNAAKVLTGRRGDSSRPSHGAEPYRGRDSRSRPWHPSRRMQRNLPQVGTRRPSDGARHQRHGSGPRPRAAHCRCARRVGARRQRRRPGKHVHDRVARCAF